MPKKSEQVRGLRTLGADGQRGTKPAVKPRVAQAVKDRAHALLVDEFDKALALLEKRKAEAAVGGKEKGRDPSADAHRSVIASLEGMNRLALGLGLLTPAQSRELYADAIKRGLYEGWK